MTEYILRANGYKLADWAVLDGIPFDMRIRAEGTSAEIVETVPSDPNDPRLESIKWWNTTNEMEEFIGYSLVDLGNELVETGSSFEEIFALHERETGEDGVRILLVMKYGLRDPYDGSMRSPYFQERKQGLYM